MASPLLFTWQFNVRNIYYNSPSISSSVLIANNLVTTIASDNIENARLKSKNISKQTLEKFDNFNNLQYVSTSSGKIYPTIQELISSEKPYFISDNMI